MTDLYHLVQRLHEIGPGDFRAVWRALGQAGFFDPLRDRETLPDGCRALEALAYRHHSLGIFISIISGCGLAVPILAAASEAAGDGDGSGRGDELLAAMLRGEELVCVAITEPDAGSDVFGMRTALTTGPDGDLRLDGEKWSITNAPVADHVIAFCQNRTGHTPFLSAVLVPVTAPGVTIGPALRLSGAHGSPTGAVRFDDVRVRPDQVLGRPDHGKLLLDLAFTRERILAPWPLLGKMSRVLQEGLDHVERRHQFGAPLKSFQYVQGRLVAGFADFEAVRLLAAEAVSRYVETGDAQLHASLAKSRAAEVAADVFRSMVALHGSYGVLEDAGLAQHLVDALCAGIAGGTVEMHRRVIFDQLVLDRSRARRSGRSRLFSNTHATTGET